MEFTNDEILSAYDVTFDLLRDAYKGPAPIIHHSPTSKTLWSYWPSKSKPYPIYRILMNNVQTPGFVLGGSSRTLPNSRWFAIEADGTDLIDEPDLPSIIRPERIDWFRSHGLNVRTMLSGNRSVHLQAFFTLYIENRTLKVLKEALSLIFTVPADKTSLTSGMRFPGFKHQKTGLLSRYPGLMTQMANVAYLIELQRDELNDRQILEVCDQAFNEFGRPEPKTIRLSPEPRQKALGSSQIDSPGQDHISIDLTNRWAGTHPQRDEFLGYVQNGIPRNQWREKVVKGDFSLWAILTAGGKQEGRTLLQRVARIGVTDKTTIQNRDEQIEYRLQLLKDPTRTSNRELSEADKALIEEKVIQIEALEILPKLRKTDRTLQESRLIMEKMMKVVRFGESGGFGVREAARLISSNLMHAKRLMDLFCSHNRHEAPIPIFEMKKEAVLGERTRRWKLLA